METATRYRDTSEGSIQVGEVDGESGRIWRSLVLQDLQTWRSERSIRDTGRDKCAFARLSSEQ